MFSGLSLTRSLLDALPNCGSRGVILLLHNSRTYHPQHPLKLHFPTVLIFFFAGRGTCPGARPALKVVRSRGCSGRARRLRCHFGARSTPKNWTSSSCSCTPSVCSNGCCRKSKGKSCFCQVLLLCRDHNTERGSSSTDDDMIVDVVLSVEAGVSLSPKLETAHLYVCVCSSQTESRGSLACAHAREDDHRSSITKCL